MMATKPRTCEYPVENKSESYGLSACGRPGVYVTPEGTVLCHEHRAAWMKENEVKPTPRQPKIVHGKSVLYLRIPSALHDAVEQAARNRGVNVTEWVTQLLERGVSDGVTGFHQTFYDSGGEPIGNDTRQHGDAEHRIRIQSL